MAIYNQAVGLTLNTYTESQQALGSTTLVHLSQNENNAITVENGDVRVKPSTKSMQDNGKPWWIACISVKAPNGRIIDFTIGGVKSDMAAAQAAAASVKPGDVIHIDQAFHSVDIGNFVAGQAAGMRALLAGCVATPTLATTIAKRTAKAA